MTPISGGAIRRATPRRSRRSVCGRMTKPGSRGGKNSKRQDRAWDEKAYVDLRTSLQSLPSGPLRDAALKRIEILDCSSPDKTLQSCDPAAAPPPEAAAWRNAVMTHLAGVDAYRAALAESLEGAFLPRRRKRGICRTRRRKIRPPAWPSWSRRSRLNRRTIEEGRQRLPLRRVETRVRRETGKE